MMNSKDLVFVALRVLAIYFLIAALSSVVSSISAGLSLNLADEAKSYATEFFYFSLFPFILYIVVTIILWKYAYRLSQIVVGDTSNNNSKDTIDIKDLQIVIFASIGLYLIFSSLPYVASSLYAVFEDRSDDNKSYVSTDTRMRIIGMFLEIILGIVLFFGARGFSGLLTWARSLGLKLK